MVGAEVREKRVDAVVRDQPAGFGTCFVYIQCRRRETELHQSRAFCGCHFMPEFFLL